MRLMYRTGHFEIAIASVTPIMIIRQHKLIRFSFLLQIKIFHMAGFFLVLVIAVIAYGIFMHTLLFPDVTVSWKILFQVLFRPYLLAFGELGVEKHDRMSNAYMFNV